MDAARALDPPRWGATVETIIGLLWTTGMRVGEVLRLNVDDLDADSGVLTVWLSKFGKTRLVPLAPSTIAALGRYRAQLPATLTTPAMFVDARLVSESATHGSTACSPSCWTRPGSPPPTGRRPRAHDLRHSFAVRTLLGWYRDGADVQALLPRLSTYLGHVEPASTYWYLSAAPELMALAAQRLEHRDGADR